MARANTLAARASQQAPAEKKLTSVYFSPVVIYSMSYDVKA